MKRVAIVGGGISGLAAAYALRDLRPVVYEARDRLGGVITTVEEAGFVIEGGPDSFITMYPWARELCVELGIEADLQPIPEANRRVYVLSRGRLEPLPEGFMLAVPTRVWPFLASGLISFVGKLRMALDLVLPRGPEVADESIGDFIRRRFGREAVAKIADPLMGGIYMAPADRLSLRSTFPRFRDLERKHRSLILGMRRAPAGGGSPFLSLRGGMKRLIDALVSAMPGVEFRTGTEVASLDALDADAVVLATPLHAAARLAPIPDGVPYVTSTTVSLGYAGVTLPPGTGFVIPQSERRRIAACTWSSQKFEGRAPPGHTLVRCFFRGEGSVEVALDEVAEILGIRAEPVVAKRFHWPAANPIYEVGHEERVREIEARLPPRVLATGSAYRGVGIPHCVRDARETAAKVRQRLGVTA